MKIDKPGIVSGVPMEAYLADPCPVPSLNASTAVLLLRQSPLHAWTYHPRHPKPQPRDESRAASIGTVAHAMLLEGSEAGVCAIDPQEHPAERTSNIPDGYTNKSIRAARDQAIEDGLTPLLPAELAACRGMRDAALAFLERLKKNPRGRPIGMAFEAGEAETIVVAQEGPTWLRCRPDWISNDRMVAIHLKTTARSAEPNAFIRGLLPSMGYDLTLGFYGRVIGGTLGQEPELHCILAQEQEPPYACSLIGLNPEYASIVSHRIDVAINTWARCMKSGNWPAYPEEICYAEPKPWQIAESEEEQIKGFLGREDPVQKEHGFQI